MTLERRQLCSATNRKGGPCRRSVLPGLAECVMHRPETRELASRAAKASAIVRAEKARKNKEAKFRSATLVEIEFLTTGRNLSTADGWWPILDHVTARVLRGDTDAPALAQALTKLLTASEALVRLRGFDEQVRDLHALVNQIEARNTGRMPLLAAVRKEDV